MFKGKKIVQGNEQAIHAKKEAEKNQEQSLQWQMPSAGDDCTKLMLLNTLWECKLIHIFRDSVSVARRTKM